MEYNQKLIQYALSNAKKLGITVERYHWIDKWLPGYFDFSVTFPFRGQNLVGRGIANSEKLAFVKALSEAFERSVIIEYNFYSSNGIAAHETFEKAKECAINELIERDSFYCHWLTQTKIKELTLSNFYSNIPWLENVAQIVAKNKIQLRIGMLEAVNNQFTILCVAEGSKSCESFGVILGIGNSKSITKAVEQACFETVRNLATYLNDKNNQFKIITIDEFLNKESPTLEDHMKLGLDATYATIFNNLFSTNVSEPISKNGDEINFQISKLELPHEINDAPICIVKAESKELQDAWFGKTTSDKINTERVSKFLKLSKNETMNLVMTPHPFG